MLQRFLRGQFDAELTETVAHNVPNLNVQLFRLLHLFGAKIEVPAPVSVAHMQRGLSEAALDSEEGDLKWQEVKLNTEVESGMNTMRRCCSGNVSQSLQDMPTSHILRGSIVR